MRATAVFLGVPLLFASLACSSDGPSGTGGTDAGAVGQGAGGRSGASGAQNGGGRTGTGGRTAGGGRTGAGGGSVTGDGVTYGDPYEGGVFHRGPVDWEETEWHNACAPGTKYAPSIRQAEGDLLAGLWNGIPDVAGYCDACIQVTTEKGVTAVLRVVTYGDTTTNSIDVSPAACAVLDCDQFPRNMTWQFAKCPDTGAVFYEFQTGSSQWWTSLWVRNARVPLEKVEVMSANHGSYVALDRGSDGTLTDPGGFGEGPFTIRLTGIDGQEVTDSFDWPAAGIAGQMLRGAGNFQ